MPQFLQFSSETLLVMFIPEPDNNNKLIILNVSILFLPASYSASRTYLLWPSNHMSLSFMPFGFMG